PPDPVQPLGEADGRRRLALAERRRADGRHDDVFAARVLGLDPLDPRDRDLRLRVPVWLDLVVAEPEIAGDLHDRPGGDRASDLEVGREGGCGHWTPRVGVAAARAPTVAAAGSGDGLDA